jgi:hypothetical protein
VAEGTQGKARDHERRIDLARDAAYALAPGYIKPAWPTLFQADAMWPYFRTSADGKSGPLRRSVARRVALRGLRLGGGDSLSFRNHRHVVADRASGGGAQDSMMVRHMTGHTPYDRAGHATDGVGRTHAATDGEAQGGDESDDLHGHLPKVCIDAPNRNGAPATASLGRRIESPDQRLRFRPWY